LTVSAHRLALAVAPAVAAVALLVPATSTASPSSSLALGVYVRDAGIHPGRIDRYRRVMGRSPAIVSEYKQWDERPFDSGELRQIWERGALPMVTWEPMSYSGARYPLRAIADGRFDRYLRRSAVAAREWGKPILVRFAHEMNGDWYAWGTDGRGHSPQLYRRAWRRVVAKFKAAGADNVRWVWCPNVNQSGRLPFVHYYPGDRWVDWVGLDGFNWGYRGSYFSFKAIFGRSYRALARLSNAPIMIAETGAADRRKARWITQGMRRQVSRYPRIRALVWFNAPVNGVDLRFDGTRQGLRAFRGAARSARYSFDRSGLLELGP
jgi:hypothetical protein